MQGALAPEVACGDARALHGLGHWHAAYPDVVEATVDRFLAASIGRRPELVAYARSARAGCVQ